MIRKPYSIETSFRQLGIATLTIWFFVTYFQGGSRPDESEHCHAAWLMAVQGLTPFTDFFQHHSPMLWDVLALFYRMGGDGVAVLFWGRVVSLACVMTVAWCVWKSLRLTASAEDSQIPFSFVMLIFGTTSLLMNENFIIRPEIISCALFALAWLFSRTIRIRGGYSPAEKALGTFAAGALYGLCVYSSPRFVLLAPLFALGEWGRSRTDALRTLGVFALGAAAAFAAYLRVDGLGFRDFYVHVLLFSAKLQKMGEAPRLRRFYWDRSFFSAAPLAATLFLCEFYRRRAPERKVESGLWLALVVTVMLASIGLSYPHTYPQNFIPTILVMLFAIVEVGRNFSWRKWEPTLKPALIVAFLWSITTLTTDLRKWVFREHDIFSVYLEKSILLSHLQPGDTVLLPYDRHPIAAPDASFYAGYLESEDRRQKAFSEWARTVAEMPPFDLIADLREKKPKLIAPPSLLYVIPHNDRPELKEIRQTWYHHPYATDPRWEYSHIGIRRDFPRQVRVSALPRLNKTDFKTFP